MYKRLRGIENEFPEQEHFISLITFNGLGQKILHFIDPVTKLETIDDRRYSPDASTPLYDAMGFSFAKLKQVLHNLTNYNVLVTILTDGEENASKEYTGASIKKIIEELKTSGWTFTYIGAEHDVEKFATSISITNTMVFEKNDVAMEEMFVKEKAARKNYSQKIRAMEDLSQDFYKPTE